METSLSQTERDFIKFLSEKRGVSYGRVEDVFLATRERFDFSSLEYRNLSDTLAHLYRILYDDTSEEELIDAYRFHALTNLFRFIKYPEMGLGDFAACARTLVERINKIPIVVDYGCGLGYISFEIGRLRKDSKIYLVDIDCLTLEFAEFRFREHEVEAEIIPIYKNEIYPKLPMHNICIAMNVMEHLMKPLTVYQNIYDNLERGGILYGNFGDCVKEMFHVSPNLNELLGERIAKDFRGEGGWLYIKV